MYPILFHQRKRTELKKQITDMSLYDSMNYKDEKRPLYEGEEKITYGPIDVVAEQVGVPDVVETTEEVKPATSAERPATEFKYTNWWQSPSYVSQEESSQKAAMERMKAEEKRAKRQRNVAIFGDLARLGAQMYAANGGSTQIERFTPQTQIANERLAALRDKHAAQIESFARSMNAAKKAESADKNARMKAETDYAQADAAARYKAAKDAADMQFRINQAEAAAKQKDEDRKSRERIAADRLKSQERIAANRESRLLAQAGRTKKEQELYDEYQNLLIDYPEYKVVKKVVKRNAADMIEKNPDGSTAYEVVEELNPTVNQVRNAIARANAKRGKVGSGVLKTEGGSPLRKSEYSKKDNAATW